MTEQHLERAVVGLDFDESGDDAIAEALRWLSDKPARVLHALHVIDPKQTVKDNRVQPALVAKEQALARVPEELANWIDQIAHLRSLQLDERIHVHARIGDPVETTLQFAIDYEANLLIVGTHGRRGLERLLLGSVAEALVRGARCPVLVARPTVYADTTKTTLPDAPYPPGQEPDYAALSSDLRRARQTRPDRWQTGSGRPTGFRIV